MTEITLVGIDLAKNVFQLCATDGSGRIVKERRLRRAGLLSELSALPPCVVAMEACGGAHDWGRRIAALGHEVRLLHPRRVAAFVGAHKNDRVDTRAICEAARQPGTRFVPVKNLRQQELQSLVRLRDGLVKQRTSSITPSAQHPARTRPCPAEGSASWASAVPASGGGGMAGGDIRAAERDVICRG